MLTRKATKQIPGFKELSYPERLRRLNLPILAYRRLSGDMIEVFKILQNIYMYEVVVVSGPRRTLTHSRTSAEARKALVQKVRQHDFRI